jgi:hypothetical protein
MLPIPVLIVIVICGTVVAYMVAESCYVTIQNIKQKLNKKQPPLSACDESTSNRNDDRRDDTNDIL